MNEIHLKVGRYTVKIDTPKIPEDLMKRRFTDIFFEEDLEFEICRVTDSEFSGEALDQVRLYKTLIKNCDFSNTDFSRFDLTYVQYVNCVLLNTNLSHVTMHLV